MAISESLQVTVSAPVNLAVVKYWAKRDTELILPTNSSLSLTLSQDHLRSKTTLDLSPDHETDRLWLNGFEETISPGSRFANVLLEARRLRALEEAANPTLPKLSEWKMHIGSENNFPTAAGLASSASGFACFTFALYKALNLSLTLSEVSRLARIGSGSACRSLFGGFVAWEMGERTDGLDSLAVQIAPETHWPEMEALIFVVSDAKKDIGSTVGMQRTLQTSPLIQERIAKVPGTMKRMEAAILSRDFDAFAELTMRDSNQFHAVCMDTFPPVFYLTDVSKGIIQTVTLYNQLCQARGLGYRAAYTFDAGPNAVVFLKREHVSQFLGIMNYFFPCPSTDLERASEYYGRAMDFVNFWEQDEETREFLGQMEKLPVFPKGSFKRIISTQVGDGPRLLASTYEPSVSLLDDKGWPVSIV